MVTDDVTLLVLENLWVDEVDDEHLEQIIQQVDVDVTDNEIIDEKLIIVVTALDEVEVVDIAVLDVLDVGLLYELDDADIIALYLDKVFGMVADDMVDDLEDAVLEYADDEVIVDERNLMLQHIEVVDEQVGQIILWVVYAMLIDELESKEYLLSVIQQLADIM